MTATYYIVERLTFQWVFHSSSYSIDTAMATYETMKAHREQGTGPNTHWRVIERTDKLIVSTTQPQPDK